MAIVRPQPPPAPQTWTKKILVLRKLQEQKLRFWPEKITKTPGNITKNPRRPGKPSFKLYISRNKSAFGEYRYASMDEIARWVHTVKTSHSNEPFPQSPNWSPKDVKTKVEYTSDEAPSPKLYLVKNKLITTTDFEEAVSPRKEREAKRPVPDVKPDVKLRTIVYHISFRSRHVRSFRYADRRDARCVDESMI